MANLIQNYTDVTKKYYNNLSDANSENLLKPLDGKGYLVRNNIATAPVEFAKDTYYTAKSLTKGVAGKANDHELGKLNDLGLKIGGLTIATYLMTKKQIPKTKAMEFIGFGTFLASMSLWPKVALQWPARLIHGFNFRKQYVDEQGRKKYVTQDPNYMPMDLYKGERRSEDLSVIADRAGIRKDIKDRNELAKEHIRKVSVQNHTLWMLTAGTATPVMTALACNALDKPIGKFTERYSNNKINKLTDHIQEYLTTPDSNRKQALENQLIAKNVDKTNEKQLAKLLEAKKGQIITQSDINMLSEVLTEGLDIQTQKAANKDLCSMLRTDNTLVNNDTVLELTENITKKLDTKYGEGFTSSILDTKQLAEHIDGYMSANANSSKGILSAEKTEELRLSIGRFIEDTTAKNDVLRPQRKNIVNSMFLESVDEVFGSKKVAVLTDEATEQISKAGNVVRKFRAFDESISKATHFKVEKAPETILGNNWSDVTETLIKELNISPKELNEAKSSEELTAKLFTHKLELLAKDENSYQRAVSNIADKMLELDTKLDNPRAGKKGAMDVLVDSICKNCENTAGELNSLGSNGNKSFVNLAKRINGEEINGLHVGTVREAKVQRIKQARLGGVQNAYARLLHTMDFFKRAQEFEAGKGGFSGNAPLDKALIEKGKKVLMSSHSGDFFLKFQTGNNVDFYKGLMWHTFESGNMSEATKKALSKTSHEVFNGGVKTSMAQRVTSWAKYVGALMGKNVYDFLPNHITDYREGISNFANKQTTAVEKFNKIACAPENMLYNALKQKYNSNKWLKLWGTVGAIVLTGTVAAQFTFGKKDDSIKG